MIRALWAPLPAAVRLSVLATSVVALGAAVLSWNALVWGAGQLGIDPHLTWLFPLTIDGLIVSGTIAVFALRHAPRRVRWYVWTILLTAIACSVIGNGAHAAAGSPIHEVGAAIPALALALSTHLTVVLVRHVPAPRARTAARTEARGRGARTTRGLRVLFNGREVSPGHARKLRARSAQESGGATA